MRVVVAGYGAEGRASFEYFSQLGHEVAIADERQLIDGAPPGVDLILGEGAFSRLEDFDMVVRTPGVRPDKIKTGGKIWSASNEFFAHCPAPIIGVTGTKGKGTTSSLIASILRAADYNVHLIGNIGLPALTELPKISENDIVVFELSSFQLWDLTRSPHVAVVLGIEADHLDVHPSFEDYVGAKSNIRRYQAVDDMCFFHPTSSVARQIADIHPGAKRYSTPGDGAVYAENGWFYRQGEKICSVDSLQIPGGHNIENACAALSVASEYTDDTAAMERGLRSFTGLDHRIKLIHESEGVRFYDDSYSSAPAATMAAIKAFSEPEILLIGGYDKGADFSQLASCVADASNIKKVILYGQTRERIAAAFADAAVPGDLYESLETTDFSEIVTRATQQAEDGDVVILSPACASFDMFANFTERGELFTDLVRRL